MKYPFKRTLFILLACPLIVSAQREPPQSSSFDSRIFTGGDFGLQFGSLTLVEIAPIVGYKVTDRFTPGVGITYIYERIIYPPNTSPNYSTSIYGGNVFLRYYILPSVFAHVEYQVLNLDVQDHINYYYTSYRRADVPNLFIGGGYRQPLGGRSSFNILLLYDIIQSPNSPYTNPVIEVGFGIGI